MATALVILWAVLGGLWRRMFGGWTGLPRSICYALMAPLTLPIWLALPWGVYWPYSVIAGIGSTALCLLFFVVSLYPGGKFTDDRDVLLKYGPFGIGYVLAHRFWRDEWNRGSRLCWRP
ncbi:protein of unknown function [Magnetospirillum sp. XM-1]|uniref:hypothetical protein n=1 Tax=Magnetospirillum sp. XM-1 TaxID=1663591 RepID=UPI00073DC8E6|nr:hypothetical protein [Magnetospirillum sp. XM-1]CUW40261.1 protein of unknown function [Magnetospirillum sp. XM-1]